MKIIIGLGNPTDRYHYTRHNLGQLALEEFHSKQAHNFSNFSANKKVDALIASGNINSEQIILAKPLTFMNESGLTAKKIISFYKAKPTDLWVIHDELDLPLGKIKISSNVSAAGHKGVASIINSLQTKNFVRFRLGIGKNPTADPNWVIQKFTTEEIPLLNKVLQLTNEAILTALTKGIQSAQTIFNQKNSL